MPHAEVKVPVKENKRMPGRTSLKKKILAPAYSFDSILVLRWIYPIEQWNVSSCRFMGKSEGGALVLLGCDTVSIGSWWSKFWDRLVTPSSRVGRTNAFLKVSKQLFLFDTFFTNCNSICAGNVSDQELGQKKKFYDTHVTTRTKISTNHLVKRNFSARCLLSVGYRIPMAPASSHVAPLFDKIKNP